MQLKLAQAGMLSVASRFKSDKPRNLAAKNAMGRLQIALDGVLSKHAANAAKTELSADGKRVANRAGLTDAFAEILRSTKTVEVFNAKLNEWELRVRTPPAPDKSDLAAAILRSENRAVLRSRPAGERLGAALADPSVLASALEGSDLASGLTRDMRKTLTDHFVASDPVRAKAMEEISESREAVESLKATVDFLRGAVGTAGEFANGNEFTTALGEAVGDRAADIETQATRAVDSMSV